jgi:hypothetical protein
LVVSTVSTPVSSFRTVTVAPGTAEPWLSVTTPEIVPLSERCARSGVLESTIAPTAASTARATTWNLDICILRREFT